MPDYQPTPARCLIVDDEQLAREMLEAYCLRVPGLTVAAKCKSAAEAAAVLAREKIDLIFLDIQMPQLNGTEFLRRLPDPPKVIFTTAFSDYALEGFELEVTDYLLKPIGFARFEKAVQKALETLAKEQKALSFEEQQSFDNQFIMVKQGYDHHKVFLKDILYIAALREYVQYHTRQGKFMELKPISKVEKELPGERFLRIHRSYIVARSAVEGQVGGCFLLANGDQLPIGKTYRQVTKQVVFGFE